MQVIYIDTLFLLNAIVDYLLLLAAARVAGEPLYRLRFLLGALVGGGYAVAIFLFPFLQAPFYKILLCCLIITLAYGHSQRLLRQGLIFLALSFAFAGGILAISLFGGQGLTLQGGVLYSPMDLKMVLLSAACCYGLLTILFRGFGKHTSCSGELVDTLLVFHDKEIHFTSLVDTGNTLTDPLSGHSVLVVEGRYLAPFFSEKSILERLDYPAICLEELSSTPFSHRLRLLPYKAVGVQGLLLALRVDEIYINGQLQEETLVALSPNSLSDGGNYQGLVGETTPKRTLKSTKKTECIQ